MVKTFETKRDVKIAILETKLTALSEDVKEIKDNHLAHIYDRLGTVEKKLAQYVGGLAVLIFILQFVLPVFLKLIN